MSSLALGSAMGLTGRGRALMTARSRRLDLALLALAAVVLLGSAAVRGLALFHDATSARAVLTEAIGRLESGGPGLAEADVAAIADGLRRGDAALARLAAAVEGDPLVAAIRLAPPARAQVDAAGRLLRAARLLTSRHEHLEASLRGYLAARDGTVGLERIAAFARLAAESRARTVELAAALDEATRLVSMMPAEGLIPELASIRTLLAERLAQARAFVGPGAAAQEVLPSILGLGAERRYLVLTLNPAELRPAGGYIGAFATPRFRDGLLGEHRFRDVYEVDLGDADPYVRPPQALRAHLLGDQPWQLADAGWSPDFAVSAAAARRLYGSQTGDSDFDGVIAFTPALVDRLLEITGPVQVGEVTVAAGQTLPRIQEQVDVNDTGPDRKRFLVELAWRAIDAALALPPERYPAVAAALHEAGRGRQLQVVLDDPRAQSFIEAHGWYTPFVFPAGEDRLAIIDANVSPVSKLHLLLRMDHQLEVRLRADGNAEERLVTTMTNGYGPDLPPLLEPLRPTFRHGNLGSYQRRYLVPDARVLSVASDGYPSLDAPEHVAHELGSLTVGNYQMVAPGTVHLETRYLAPQVVATDGDPGASGRYRLTFRKQAGRDQDTLTVHVTVPPGAFPVSWSEGGIRDGSMVTFRTTTATDRFFEVIYHRGDT